MTELLELPRRVDALEVAQNETTQTMRWVVARLGRVCAVQDEHSLRLDRIESRLDRVEKKIDDLTTSLPALIADTMREVLRERG